MEQLRVWVENEYYLLAVYGVVHPVCIWNVLPETRNVTALGTITVIQRVVMSPIKPFPRHAFLTPTPNRRPTFYVTLIIHHTLVGFSLAVPIQETKKSVRTNATKSFRESPP